MNGSGTHRSGCNAHLRGMWSTRQRAFVVVTTIIAFLVACKKDEATPTTAAPSGGVAPPALPAWVVDSLGPFVPHVTNPSTAEGIALGRRLFYEKALSNDYTQSCGSCHLQANAFTDPRPFSVGTDGSLGTRNAMAIINSGWDHRFFWDGRSGSLESQAHDPVVNPIEMNNTWPEVVARLQADATYPPLFLAAFGTETIDSLRVTRALAQFERSLVSFRSPYDRYYYEGDSTALNEQEVRGMEVYKRGGHCIDCHMGPLISDHSFRNNGLDVSPSDGGLGALTGVPSDWGRFKVPTLRNIALTAPYMHDSRFTTLEEVVHFYAHDVQLGNPNLDGHMDPWRFGLVNLDAQDEADLVAFLRALTDESFIADPAFGPPAE